MEITTFRMSSRDDDDTVERVQIWTDSELLTLYPRVRRFAAVVAPIEVGPDDLMQEAIERMLRRPREQIDSPEAYLRRTLVSCAANHRRRFGRWRRAVSRLDLRDDSATAEYPSDIGFLDQVPPVARAVLYLQEVEGRGLRDVAAELGISESAAKQIAHRARITLRASLQEENQ